MAEPADSALATATKLLTDNRTVVYGRTGTGTTRVAVLPTLPNGLLFGAKTPAGADISETEIAADTSKAAHVGSAANIGSVVVPIDIVTLEGVGKGNKYVRKQLFRSTAQPVAAVTEKWCYTNAKGQPLDANGAPTTVGSAVNAATTALTAVGEAVSSLTQPGPMPGAYPVSELQSLYSPYIGWTVKQTAAV